MRTVIAGKPLTKMVELCYKANLPLLVVGRHGIGKSELLCATATRLQIQYICRDLSLMEPVDLVGLPEKKGQRTIFLTPDFLPRDGRGLLVFEELNRCDKAVRAPCLQLLTARALNDYRLPEGWLPVAAINPPDPDSDYDVYDLDAALLSRFVQVAITPSQQEWLGWAKEQNVHPKVIDYVASDATIFDHPDSNPRSWRYVSDLVLTAEKTNVDLDTLRAGVFGLVGDKRGSAFLRSLRKSERPMQPTEILNSYGKHAAKLRRWIVNRRIDLVNSTLHNLLVYLQPEADFEIIKNRRDQWKNLGRFLGDLPGDLRQQANKDFKQRHRIPPNATNNGRSK